MMMAKDGDLVRVSLPKPLGIQLEEITPGAPGVRVAGVVEGGTAKENGVRVLESCVSLLLLWQKAAAWCVRGVSLCVCMCTRITKYFVCTKYLLGC